MVYTFLLAAVWGHACLCIRTIMQNLESLVCLVCMYKQPWAIFLSQALFDIFITYCMELCDMFPTQQLWAHYLYLFGISPVPSHTGSCSLQTQCSSRWCPLWASERVWWWPFDPGWRRCPCRRGWCKMGLYHSQWCSCTLADLMCTPQTHCLD